MKLKNKITVKTAEGLIFLRNYCKSQHYYMEKNNYYLNIFLGYALTSSVSKPQHRLAKSLGN